MTDNSENHCHHCKLGGSLVCCDNCPKVYHLKCLLHEVHIGDRWCCPVCVTKNGYCNICYHRGRKSDLHYCKTCNSGFHLGCHDYKISQSELESWQCKTCKPKRVTRRGNITPVKKTLKVKKAMKGSDARKHDALLFENDLPPNNEESDIMDTENDLRSNLADVLSISVLLSYFVKSFRLKPSVLTTLENGLEDPRSGALDEIFTKFLLGETKSCELTIGEGKEYIWWNTKLKQYFDHLYSTLEKSRETISTFQATNKRKTLPENILLATSTKENLEIILLDFGCRNPFNHLLQDSENKQFHEFALYDRILVLRAFIESKVLYSVNVQDDASSSCSLFRVLDEDSLRLEPVGSDSLKRNYYIFTQFLPECRVFRSTKQSKSDELLELVCSSAMELEDFTERIRKCVSKCNRALYHTLSDFLEQSQDITMKVEKKLHKAMSESVGVLSASVKRSSRLQEKKTSASVNATFITTENTKEKTRKKAIEQRVLQFSGLDATLTAVSSWFQIEVDRLYRLEVRKEKELERKEKKRLALEEKAREMELARRVEEARVEAARIKALKDKEERLLRRMVHKAEVLTDLPTNQNSVNNNNNNNNNNNRIRTRFQFWNSMSWKLLRCTGLLHLLAKNANAVPFLLPVARTVYPSYYKIILHPMDFSMIQQKLHCKEYTSEYEFARDVRLIFSNCLTYNEAGSEVSLMGRTLSMIFESLWQQWVKGVSSDCAGVWDKHIEEAMEDGCVMCGRSHDIADIMLCDDCNKEFHYKCVFLPKLPEGDWYCSNCVHKHRPPVVPVVAPKQINNQNLNPGTNLAVSLSSLTNNTSISNSNENKHGNPDLSLNNNISNGNNNYHGNANITFNNNNSNNSNHGNPNVTFNSNVQHHSNPKISFNSMPNANHINTSHVNPNTLRNQFESVHPSVHHSYVPGPSPAGCDRGVRTALHHTVTDSTTNHNSVTTFNIHDKTALTAGSYNNNNNNTNITIPALPEGHHLIGYRVKLCDRGQLGRIYAVDRQIRIRCNTNVTNSLNNNNNNNNNIQDLLVPLSKLRRLKRKRVEIASSNSINNNNNTDILYNISAGDIVTYEENSFRRFLGQVVLVLDILYMVRLDVTCENTVKCLSDFTVLPREFNYNSINANVSKPPTAIASAVSQPSNFQYQQQYYRGNTNINERTVSMNNNNNIHNNHNHNNNIHNIHNNTSSNTTANTNVHSVLQHGYSNNTNNYNTKVGIDSIVKGPLSANMTGVTRANNLVNGVKGHMMANRVNINRNNAAITCIESLNQVISRNVHLADVFRKH